MFAHSVYKHVRVTLGASMHYQADESTDGKATVYIYVFVTVAKVM